MTEAEVTTDLKSDFHMEKSKPTIPDISEDITDAQKRRDAESNLTNDIPNSTESVHSLVSGTDALTNVENSGESSLDSCVSSLPSKDSPSEENEWLDIMGSGNFKKLIVKKGIGHDTRPERGDKVTAHIKFFLNDVMIEQYEKLQFIVGDMDVIQGLDLVVCLMEKGEVAKVKIPAKLAYGKIGRNPDIPPESDLDCDIEMIDVQSIDYDSLTVSDRLQFGNEKRLRGNFFYERTEYIDAIHCYERAAEYLEGIRDSSGSTAEESQKVVDMKIKVYNNMAASHLKLSAYQAALKSVESVLNVQPKNVKALFRKAKILGIQGSTEDAISCLKLAANLEPETKVIQAELVRLRNQKKKEEQSQKAMYRRMFPQSEPPQKNTSTSFSKIMTVSAVTAGVMAAVVGMAAYRQYHS